MKLEILPVSGIGEVRPGDDLAELIATAAPWLRDGDVLVVTSKIVSKAEGRLVDVPMEEPQRTTAREEILIAETARVVASRGRTRIVQTHHGFVMAAAGIDASNVDPAHLVLLPKDPDASARSLRLALRERYAVDVAVIVSDTMGRPWRDGQTDVALGVAGMAAINDHRGVIDRYGNELHVTQMAVADELAAAGDLVKGKCNHVPVAVVRGYLDAPHDDDGAGAASLVRDAALDLFSLGTAEARAAGLRTAATLADTADPEHPASPRADPAAVARAIAFVSGVVAPGTVLTVRVGTDGPDTVTCVPPTPADPSALIRFGADLHRLRAALAAEGVNSALSAGPDGSSIVAVLVLTC